MIQRFEKFETPIAGLSWIQRKPIHDTRGFFSRLFCKREFERLGLPTNIAQINQTLTEKKCTVRGMHFQYPPQSELKIVTCIKGEAFDVAVDLRSNSPSFLQWHAELLSEKKQNSLCIPEGFAHGFQALTDNCEMLYLHSSFFSPESEGGLHAEDPKLSIEWPNEITDMSERDKNHTLLDNTFTGLQVS